MWTEINFSHEYRKKILFPSPQNTIKLELLTLEKRSHIKNNFYTGNPHLSIRTHCERSKNVVHLEAGEGEAYFFQYGILPRVCEWEGRYATLKHRRRYSEWASSSRPMTSPGSVTWVKNLAGGAGNSRINSDQGWQANTLATIKLKRELIVPHAQQQFERRVDVFTVPGLQRAL